MKNKKAQLLSIFLSACILGTSAPVNAADFYSDAFSADDNVEAEPSSEISEDLSSEENSDPADSTGIDTQEESSEDLLQSPKDSNSGSTSDASDASSLEEEFNAGNEEETFPIPMEQTIFHPEKKVGYKPVFWTVPQKPRWQKAVPSSKQIFRYRTH